MTAAVGQLFGKALPATIVSLIAKNPGRWSQFVNRALAAGYGLGDVMDLLQSDEGGSIGMKRQQIQSRQARGTATPFEMAIQTQEPSRPGRALARAAGTGGVIATLSNLGGGLMGQGRGMPQPQPPPHPSALPANKSNPLTKVMQSRSGLGAQALQDQVAERGPGQIEAIAPRAYRDAQYIMSGGRSAEEAAEMLRKQAGRDQQLAQDLSRISKKFKRPLASVLRAYVPISSEGEAEQGQEVPQQAESDEEAAIIAELQKLISEL